MTYVLMGIKARKDSGRSARHSKESPEWYTPAEYALAAWEVMGGIDLDPASCAKANRVIRAHRYFTKKKDGLKRVWEGRIFLNPPGGLVKDFWRELWFQHMAQSVTQAVWIGYSLEQLQTLQNVTLDGCDVPSPLTYPICVPRRRIAFNFPDRPDRKSPTHANYIIYIGPRRQSFYQVFSRFGEVRF